MKRKQQHSESDAGSPQVPRSGMAGVRVGISANLFEGPTSRRRRIPEVLDSSRLRRNRCSSPEFGALEERTSETALHFFPQQRMAPQ